MRSLVGRDELACINTATLGFREPIETTARRVAAAGFGYITPWRREIDEADPEAAAKAFKEAGLKVGGYCRTDYFCADDVAGARAAVESNRRAVEVAAVLGAPFVVAVVGGLAPSSKDADACRHQILEGLASLIPVLRATG